MQQKVRLIAQTVAMENVLGNDTSIGGAERLIAYCARVSSANQENPNYEKLLKYCWKNGHVSVFETASMTVEITTSRAIAPQLLRHRSFTFQEFSQRYAEVTDFIDPVLPRLQDAKNRQSSIETEDEELQQWFLQAQTLMAHTGEDLYLEALSRGVAKEQARLLLPASAATRIYMTGNVRSWMHYLMSRTDPATQKEHREIAEMIKEIFQAEFPVCYKVAFG